MKSILGIFLIVVAVGILPSGIAFAESEDGNSKNNANNANTGDTGNVDTGIPNLPDDSADTTSATKSDTNKIANKIKKLNASTSNKNKADRSEEKNETKTAREKIAAKVKAIVAAEKNGSVDIPPGMIIRIIAKNRSMSIDEAITEFENTSEIKFMRKNRTMKMKRYQNETEWEDGDTSVRTSEDIRVENETITIGDKNRTVKLMPSEIVKRIKAIRMANASLQIEEDTPTYRINATKRARLLGIFDVEMDTETTVDANSGDVKRERRPWWAFMTTEGLG